ncbi:hypothetical protein LSUE1_G003240 [Lachnellula suecica]|uniref:RING-type domain-containing protein n=1 Tax=Lachnellula suecica TaxID=602035 RepID=A0A8T9CC84_9HELO|nr:hypothetical protein LSUE1_G003240 [Lachnellula suecica]
MYSAATTHMSRPLEDRTFLDDLYGQGHNDHFTDVDDRDSTFDPAGQLRMSQPEPVLYRSGLIGTCNESFEFESPEDHRRSPRTSLRPALQRVGGPERDFKPVRPRRTPEVTSIEIPELPQSPERLSQRHGRALRPVRQLDDSGLQRLASERPSLQQPARPARYVGFDIGQLRRMNPDHGPHQLGHRDQTIPRYHEQPSFSSLFENSGYLTTEENERLGRQSESRGQMEAIRRQETIHLDRQLQQSGEDEEQFLRQVDQERMVHASRKLSLRDYKEHRMRMQSIQEISRQGFIQQDRLGQQRVEEERQLLRQRRREMMDNQFREETLRESEEHRVRMERMREEGATRLQQGPRMAGWHTPPPLRRRGLPNRPRTPPIPRIDNSPDIRATRRQLPWNPDLTLAPITAQPQPRNLERTGTSGATRRRTQRDLITLEDIPNQSSNVEDAIPDFSNDDLLTNEQKHHAAKIQPTQHEILNTMIPPARSECVVCMDSKPRSEMRRPNCGHWYCQSCFADGFQTSLNSRTPFVCCDGDGISIDSAAAIDFLHLTFREHYAHVFRFQELSMFETDEKTKQALDRRDETLKVEERKNDQATFDLAANVGWNQCPDCGNLIEKNEGYLKPNATRSRKSIFGLIDTNRFSLTRISSPPLNSVESDSRTLLPQTPAQSRLEDLEPTWTRLLIVPGLLVTTILNILLIAAVRSGWAFTGVSARRINDNPSTFSAIRQILASLLGMVYLYSICMIINWSTRVVLAHRPVSLDRLDFWSALASARLDWTLPGSKIPFILIFVILTRIPAALWAGALAPQPTTADHRDSHLTTSVPHYTTNSLNQFEPQSLFNSSDPLISTPLGVFSFSPVRDRFGFLLNDGASASTQNTSLTPLYKKNDNTNYTYYGRSYGVGASVGLVGKHIQKKYPGLSSFSFNETGSYADVSCSFNRSTQFHLELQYDPKSDIFPNIYEATGCAPWVAADACGTNGFSEIGMSGDDSIVAVAWWPQYRKVTDYSGTLGITAGSNYTQLNYTQCNVALVPRRYTVNVDVKQGLIHVDPLDGTVNSTNPLVIVESAFNTLAALSEVASTKFTSAIGNMLNSNINNVQLQQTSETNETKTLRAISESIKVLTDDALVAYSSAQLMLVNVSSQVPVSVTVDAVAVGTSYYIYIVAGINATVVLAVLFEAVRTKGWKGMPRYNYMSVKSTIVSSSMAGRAVGDKSGCLHDATGYGWTGSARDRSNGSIKVNLRRANGLALILADGNPRYQTGSTASGIDLTDWRSDRRSMGVI